MAKYVGYLVTGQTQVIQPITSSAGAGDGAKIAQTDATGKWDPSLIPGSPSTATPTEVLPGITWVLAVHTQTLFRRPIVLDAGAVIVGAADAVLVGV